MSYCSRRIWASSCVTAVMRPDGATSVVHGTAAASAAGGGGAAAAGAAGGACSFAAGDAGGEKPAGGAAAVVTGVVVGAELSDFAHVGVERGGSTWSEGESAAPDEVQTRRMWYASLHPRGCVRACRCFLPWAGAATSAAGRLAEDIFSPAT